MTAPSKLTAFHVFEVESGRFRVDNRNDLAYVEFYGFNFRCADCELAKNEERDIPVYDCEHIAAVMATDPARFANVR